MGTGSSLQEGNREMAAALATGKHALKAGHWSDAAVAFEDALGIGEDPAAYLGLGEAVWWLGDPERSVELYRLAYLGFREVGDTRSAVWAALWLALTHGSDFGNSAAFRGWLSRAERLIDESCQAMQGWVYLVKAYGVPDPLPSRELAQRALELAHELDDRDLELSALAHLGRTLVTMGSSAEGLALVDEAMAGALGGECESLITVVFTSCSMVEACNLAADLERASHWCAAADRFIAKHGCPYLHAQCRVGYGSILVSTGNWAEAEQQLDQAIRVTREAYLPFRTQALARLAELRLDQGRLEEAESLLEGLEDLSAGALAAARIRLARGQASIAAAMLQRRVETLAQRPVEQARVMRLLVEALVEDGNPDDARQVSQRLSDLARSVDNQLVSAHAYSAQAIVLVSQGDASAAQAKLERTLETYRDQPLPLEAARVRLELARLISMHRPEVAIAEARSAASVFEELGARPYADAAAELLRSLGAAGRGGKRGQGPLTPREREVFRLLCEGLSNPAIAARLRISRKTTAHHVSSVLAKLDLQNRAQAAAYGLRHPDLRTHHETGLEGTDRR